MVSELLIHLVNLDSDVEDVEDPESEVLKPLLSPPTMILVYLDKKLKCSTENTGRSNVKRKEPFVDAIKPLINIAAPLHL